MTGSLFTTPCPHEREDAAYVLGALSPEERVAFERHLPGCPECGRSVRELAGLPGLLARIPVEIIEPEAPPPPVPDTLLPGLVRRVRTSERRRAWLLRGAVAAAVTAAAITVGAITLGDRSDSGASADRVTTSAPQLMQPVGDEPLSGWLSLTTVGWGTQLDLTCTYAEDSESFDHVGGSTYDLFVHTSDGRIEQVGSWHAVPGRTMHVAGATAAARATITAVEVRSADGEQVLQLDRPAG